jgi:hypothetical protein
MILEAHVYANAGNDILLLPLFTLCHGGHSDDRHLCLNAALSLHNVPFGCVIQIIKQDETSPAAALGLPRKLAPTYIPNKITY